ncbi:fatty acid elongase 3-like [Tasmannia lanceolata]|uniref:fatty acid elongase 3-like n=1 Tax=Tasmannia lanceolata TaxID=3420 RepID=UPI004064B35B
MEGVVANVRYWLVEHPTISEFQWIPHQTYGASTQFLTTIILTYLTLTGFLHVTLPKSPTSSTPFILRLISTVHNLILLILSLTMAVGCSLSITSQIPTPRSLFCFPNPTPPSGPLFFYAYIFYLSKILEFSDTLLILLNPIKRLTFLHVYHHALVVLMCYLWLQYSQSLFPVALVTNSLVHTLMYAYYFLCSVGKPPRWKRVVTDFQIVQFVFSFGVSILLLWFHFGDKRGDGCCGMKAWGFNAIFNASLLALFMNFHFKNYGVKGREQKKKKMKGVCIG